MKVASQRPMSPRPPPPGGETAAAGSGAFYMQRATRCRETAALSLDPTTRALYAEEAELWQALAEHRAAIETLLVRYLGDRPPAPARDEPSPPYTRASSLPGSTA